MKFIFVLFLLMAISVQVFCDQKYIIVHGLKSSRPNKNANYESNIEFVPYGKIGKDGIRKHDAHRGPGHYSQGNRQNGYYGGQHDSYKGRPEYTPRPEYRPRPDYAPRGAANQYGSNVEFIPFRN